MWDRPSSPFWAPSQRGRNRKQQEEEEEAERVMVSTISLIQANLQHSIAASSILTRTVGIKGIRLGADKGTVVL